MSLNDRDRHDLEDIVDSDHEMILLLKKEIEDLSSQLTESKSDHHDTSEQLAIHEKLSAQHGLLKHIFFGVVLLVMCMWTLVFVGWATGQEAIEREMAFFERIILVFIGIVGGAVSSFFDVRNFTINTNKNGNNINNGNNKKTADTD